MNGSGVFVNSDCDPAFTQTGTSSSMTVPTGGICVVGGADSTTGVNPPPDEFCGTQTNRAAVSDACRRQPPAPYPAPSSIRVAGIAWPHLGYYDTPFPDVTPANILQIMSGVYCLEMDSACPATGWT